MSNKRHLEYIYTRLVNVYDESENIDYMIRFKEIIDDLQLQESRLLYAVSELVQAKIGPRKDLMANYLRNKDLDIEDEVKILVEALIKEENDIYSRYGIVKHTIGKIEQYEGI